MKYICIVIILALSSCYEGYRDDFHIHDWTKWDDIKFEESSYPPSVIKQQRECFSCNKVERKNIK